MSYFFMPVKILLTNSEILIKILQAQEKRFFYGKYIVNQYNSDQCLILNLETHQKITSWILKKYSTI